jgi:long-chain acyl-CoA synthetase
MSAVVLLTGATGFLGSQIARRLLESTDAVIVALVRAEDGAAAERRLARAWWDWPGTASAVGGRIEALAGDVSSPHLRLGAAARADLISRVTHIIHAAADLRLDAPLEELRLTNVRGPVNVLELARAAHRDHGLARLAHISTAYVAGGRGGEIPEDALSQDHGFASAYERSKYEGERLMQAAKADLPVSVFRPGMVVGDSRTGEIKTFNTLYFPLRFYLTGKLRFLPALPSLRVNLVPVDYVAEAVARLTFEPRAEGLNFHLTAPREMLPTARELVDFVRAWARERLGLRLPRALFVPVPALLGKGRPAQRPGKSRTASLRALLPYFNERRRFRSDNVERLLGPYAIEWRKVLPALLEFAVYNGFMHRSERTVHEQILFRLAHRSRPVTYHDVIDGRLVPRDAAAVRRDILAAAAALRAMGVRAGDRVAMAGVNSTRYLAVDTAVGLVGAAGVPLYYTSPPGECDEILAASGAKLLFVGAPGILERLGEIKSALPVVSFCRREPPAGLPLRVITWEEFLAAGRSAAVPAAVPECAPVGPGDLATVRYTSGTTGHAKGVCFDHAGLRWMAEAVCSLHPWRARNRGITYLSFLPMSHVVEGIIAAYSPYYAPSPLDICFLEDFSGLKHSIPRVRPTIFFAVPRLFEKVWAGLGGSGAGRAYLSAGPVLKRVLRPLLRRAILRRTGLDRCVQLVVGSAPSGEDLLRGFHELGIEVHNAYGLTEAPLVTMNLPGDNRLGTVGKPLPRTELRIADDGEVMVRGPQVTSGYLEPASAPPFRDGWLLTGDYGYVDDQGSLVLEGRKKELIFTSYAKKINPGKVETLLRAIPGVDEVLVAGDGRPFCVAVLWASGPFTADAVAAIERAIVLAGERLSHPERVKRWAILENDLSIERGDLTANGKLKRLQVAGRLTDVIEALYGGAAPRTCGVIRIGGEERP